MKIWVKSCKDSEPLNFLLVSPEYLEGLDFSATFGKAEKSKVGNGRIFLNRTITIITMEMPKLDEWNFPPWLVGICEASERFDEAERILIDNYGFVPTPLEKGRSDKALVLPIPGVDLEERFKSDDYDTLFSGWGIGRVRLSRAYCEQRKGPSFEFKYFPDSCSWEYICTNPMKDATIELINILKPKRFLNYLGREILNPYEHVADCN